MARFRTMRVLPLVLALVVAGCSSSGDDDDDATGDDDTTETTVEETTDTTAGEAVEGSTVGITDDAFNVAVLTADTAALAEAGLVPDIGDPVQDYEVFAQLANDEGGIGGRDIVITSHLFPPGTTATEQQPACVQATEDDQAAIVVFIGGFAAETMLCATEEHERIGYAQSGVMPQSIYDRSGSRLFAHGMSADRLMAAMVASLDANGTLDGATLGLVRADQPDHEEAATALKAALEDAGYELTEEIALPCEANACTQNETGVERLQSAGVDKVFTLLGAIPNPTFIGAASAVGYEPQWLASDFENAVFDVTAQFMEGVKDAYDGAIGFSYGLEEPDEDEFGTECNAKFTEVTGETYPYDTDKWRQVRSACYGIQQITEAATMAESDGGALNQATIIAAMETFDYALGDQRGGWSPEKHDAADTVVLKTFSADCLCWSEIEGTRDVFTG